jgi:hypothetical protein
MFVADTRDKKWMDGVSERQLENTVQKEARFRTFYDKSYITHC